ncbi:MAG: hypothetical protein KAH44_21015, partial [Oricola sp.]|nr:hypothetical protein [Oricola sp.]
MVLHPLSVTGAALEVTNDEGATERTEFPKLISPGQVAFDISKLHYCVGGVETEIVFDGDVFEMEDQRNWSDGSFKTYCRPLARPAPYHLKAGKNVRQHVAVAFRGGPPASAAAPQSQALKIGDAGERMPAIALAIDSGSAPAAEDMARIRMLRPPVLQLRVRPDDCVSVFGSAADLALGDIEIDLEAVLPSTSSIDESLAAIADAAARLGIPVARVLALPEPYLRNYQPWGPWPEGPSPSAAAIAARKAFPGADIGVGMLTNFVELNRCRPPPDLGDYVSHSSTAVFHAAEDQSVVQTLEGLGHIFESGRAIAGSRQYRLGLVSIGMRTNTHGDAVASNP